MPMAVFVEPRMILDQRTYTIYKFPFYSTIQDILQRDRKRER